MLFFMRKSKVEITGFINENISPVVDYAPVKLSKEIIPPWWKNVKAGTFNWDNMRAQLSVKSCVGIINSLTTGIIVPLWSDLAIKYDDKSLHYQYSDRVSGLDAHSPEQAPGFYSDFWITKVVSPWIFKCPYKMHLTSPFYSFPSETPYIVAPGIITPVNNYTGSHVFLFLRKNINEQRIFIKNNTPLVHIIPLTDKEIVYKTEVISDAEWQKINLQLSNSLSFQSRGLKAIRKNKE